MAEAISADFRRVQCTPDLLPSEIVGTLIYDAGQYIDARRAGFIEFGASPRASIALSQAARRQREEYLNASTPGPLTDRPW